MVSNSCEKQSKRRRLNSFTKKKDLLAVFCTGYGKTLIYQLLVLLAKRSQGHEFDCLIFGSEASLLEDIEGGKFEVCIGRNCHRQAISSITKEKQ